MFRKLLKPLSSLLPASLAGHQVLPPPASHQCFLLKKQFMHDREVTIFPIPLAGPAGQESGLEISRGMLLALFTLVDAHGTACGKGVVLDDKAYVLLDFLEPDGPHHALAPQDWQEQDPETPETRGNKVPENELFVTGLGEGQYFGLVMPSRLLHEPVFLRHHKLWVAYLWNSSTGIPVKILGMSGGLVCTLDSQAMLQPESPSEQDPAPASSLPPKPEIKYQQNQQNKQNKKDIVFYFAFSSHYSRLKEVTLEMCGDLSTLNRTHEAWLLHKQTRPRLQPEPPPPKKL